MASICSHCWSGSNLTHFNEWQWLSRPIQIWCALHPENLERMECDLLTISVWLKCECRVLIVDLMNFQIVCILSWYAGHPRDLQVRSSVQSIFQTPLDAADNMGGSWYINEGDPERISSHGISNHAFLTLGHPIRVPSSQRILSGLQNSETWSGNFSTTHVRWMGYQKKPRKRP